MKVAVAGATGLAGTAVRTALESRGVEVVPLTREHGVDLLTGKGLERLRRCEVVIDTSNITGGHLPRDVATVTAAERLVRAAVEHGTRRIAILSILGIDNPGFDDFAYYRAKREQERLAQAGPLDAVIVRSPQWFEFALNPAAITTVDDHLDVADWLIQPAAVSAVGAFLTEMALSAHTGVVSIAGPEAMRLPNLTRRVLAARGDSRIVAEVPPRIAAFGSGALLADSHTTLIGPKLDTWLTDGKLFGA